MIKQAFVHGRFQPLHIQHLEYLLGAKERCSFLWIGITKYDLSDKAPSPLAPHREYLLSNPFTFFERIEIISAALEKANVNRGEFGFIPFPIEKPEKITNFISKEIPCFTTICNEWNIHKIQVLEGLGFKVESIIDRRKQPTSDVITGELIRKIALSEGRDWMRYIPEGALETINRIDLKRRLTELSQQAK